MSRYFGQIECFDTNPTILVSLSPLEGEERSFTAEIARDLKTLASFLHRLHIESEPNQPCTEYTKYANSIMNRNLGSFYCDSDNINKLLTKLRIDLTPDQMFPGKEYPHPVLENNASKILIIEHQKLTKDTIIEKHLYKKGKQLNLYIKGYIE